MEKKYLNFKENRYCKVVSLLLTVAILVGMLTACGSSTSVFEDTDAEDEITVIVENDDTADAEGTEVEALSYTITSQDAAVMYATRITDVRSEPTIPSAVLYTLSKGDAVTVVGTVEGTNWYQVSYGDDETGYVYGSALSDVDPYAEVDGNETDADDADADVTDEDSDTASTTDSESSTAASTTNSTTSDSGSTSNGSTSTSSSSGSTSSGSSTTTTSTTTDKTSTSSSSGSGSSTNSSSSSSNSSSSTSSSSTTHTHSYTSTITTAVTCTANGIRTYTCSCGDSYTSYIWTSGHTYDSGVVTYAATCEDGQMVYTCTTCGNKQYKVISATASHTWVESGYYEEVTISEAVYSYRYCCNYSGCSWYSSELTGSGSNGVSEWGLHSRSAHDGVGGYTLKKICIQAAVTEEQWVSTGYYCSVCGTKKS